MFFSPRSLRYSGFKLLCLMCSLYICSTYSGTTVLKMEAAGSPETWWCATVHGFVSQTFRICSLRFAMCLVGLCQLTLLRTVRFINRLPFAGDGGTRWRSRKVVGSIHYGSGIDWAQRIEYQEYFLEGKGGRCLGLTTLPPSYADCLEIWEPEPPGALRACPCLKWDFFTFVGDTKSPQTLLSCLNGSAFLLFRFQRYCSVAQQLSNGPCL